MFLELLTLFLAWPGRWLSNILASRRFAVLAGRARFADLRADDAGVTLLGPGPAARERTLAWEMIGPSRWMTRLRGSFASNDVEIVLVALHAEDGEHVVGPIEHPSAGVRALIDRGLLPRASEDGGVEPGPGAWVMSAAWVVLLAGIAGIVAVLL